MNPNAEETSQHIPDLQPWRLRVFAGAGTAVPLTGKKRQRLDWMGMEMSKFLKFWRKLPPATELRDATVGYGKKSGKWSGKNSIG